MRERQGSDCLMRVHLICLIRTHEDNMDLDAAMYPVSVLSPACIVEANTARSWMQRGHLPLGSTDIGAPKKGVAIKLSARTGLVLAIAGALTRMGITPERACAAGVAFAYHGNANRLPGALFEGDGVLDTLLILAADAEYMNGEASIVPMLADSKITDFMNSTMLGRRGIDGFTVLALARRVTATLQSIERIKVRELEPVG